MQGSNSQSRLQFGAVNAALFGGAALVLGAGYLLLARGSTTAAPVLLVVGYCILLPLGLIV
jgi:hypothetical protein